MTRARTTIIAAVTAGALALFAGCTMPDDRTDAAAGDATTTTSPTGLKVNDEQAKGVLALSATVATITPGESGWTLVMDNPQPTMSRQGVGAAGSADTGEFFADPAALVTRSGAANAVIAGTPAGDGNPIYVVSVSSPQMGRDGTVSFVLNEVPAGEINRDLARAGGVAVTGEGRTGDAGALTLNPDDAAVLTDATLYLDVAGTKVVDDCPIVASTSCPGVDLFQSDLVGVNLSGSNLSGANLGMSTLRQSTFDDANLSGSQLFRSDLSDTSWVGTDIRNANAHQVTLTESDLTGIRAQSVNLFRSELDRTTLVGGDFSGSALQQSTITDANAQGARFEATNLFRVEMSGINLTDATLNDSNLAQSIAQGARMSGANLSHTDLSVADLRNADLSNADLSFANLAGANLTGANLTGANLTGAVLWMADINGANLAYTRFANTTCPDGGVTQVTNRGTAKRPNIQQTCTPIFLPAAPGDASSVGPRQTDVGIGSRAGVGNDNLYGSNVGNRYGS